VKAVDYFGHFPVADVRFEIDGPVQVSLRAYSPFLPGDPAECNTPAAVFEVRLTNVSDQPQHAALDFSPGGFPTRRAAFPPARRRCFPLDIDTKVPVKSRLRWR